MIRLTLSFLISSIAYANGGDVGRHMMDWHMGYGWYGGIFMWILLLAVIGLIVYLIVQGGQIKKSSDDETSLQILKKRYAKGEITKEEYDKIRKDLES